METLHYRKIAQIAHRDGDSTIREVATLYLPKAPGERGPMNFRKRDRRLLKAWFDRWLLQGQKPPPNPR